MSKDVETKAAPAIIGNNEFTGQIEMAIKKATETNRSIFILLLQIENMGQFRQKRPAHVVNGFVRELYSAVRTAVHPSQFVGVYQDGIGLVFDAVDPGKADAIARRLVALTQNVIRTGHYNDITSRWTDILQQFLWPNNPGMLMARVGWGVFPRDGGTPGALIGRARNHLQELATR